MDTTKVISLFILAIIILISVIGILFYRLKQKQYIDRSRKTLYNNELQLLKNEINTLNQNITTRKEQLDQLQELQKTKIADLQIADTQLAAIKQEITQIIEDKKSSLDFELKKLTEEQQKRIQELQAATNQDIAILTNQKIELSQNVENIKQDYDNLLVSYKLMEKEKLAQLFNTVQIPEEYQQDMYFLLTSVAEKVNHPDIISKLVWQEYVKPYIDQTLKRLEVKEEPGIYKLTNLENKKCYVGKSTNVKKRIVDHFKASVGIQSIADQAIHHEMLKEGIWNWMIEVVGYFNKEELNEKEKFYIEKFQGVNYGYNKTSGG